MRHPRPLPPNQPVIAIEPPLHQAHRQHHQRVAEIRRLACAERQEPIVDENGQDNSRVQGHSQVPALPGQRHFLHRVKENGRTSGLVLRTRNHSSCWALRSKLKEGISPSARRRRSNYCRARHEAIDDKDFDGIERRVGQRHPRLPRSALAIHPPAPRTPIRWTRGWAALSRLAGDQGSGCVPLQPAGYRLDLPAPPVAIRPRFEPAPPCTPSNRCKRPRGTEGVRTPDHMAGGGASGEVVLDAVMDPMESAVDPMDVTGLLRCPAGHVAHVFSGVLQALRMTSVNLRADGRCGIIEFPSSRWSRGW